MRRVIWSQDALNDIRDIRAYIEQFNPLAAQRLSLRLQTIALSLDKSSERGRLIAPSIRQIAVVRPYLLHYSVDPQEVVILRIRHSARLPVAEEES